MPTLEPNLARGRALQLRPSDYSDHLAQVMQDFANQLKLTRYSFFLQDYVGPIGFRMANAYPEMIDAIVFQNANAMAKTCPAPRFTFSMRDTLRSIKELTKSLASRKTSSIGRSGEFKGAWSDVGFTIYVVRFLRTFACDRQYVACAGTRPLCTDCRTSNCYTTDVDGSSLCRRKRGHRNRYSRNGANT